MSGDVADRHPLDPSIGDDYSKCRRGSTGLLLCGHNPVDHCHCDYHDGRHGCTWGNAEFVRRLTEGWRENRKQLRAREVAHALTGGTDEIMDAPEEWFRSLPAREENFQRGTALIDSFAILPGRPGDDHDSGYRSMGFVAFSHARPAFRFGGGSDNISFDGIGGDRGDFKRSDVVGSNWQLECLPGSGLLVAWCRGRIEIDNLTLSTFEPKARKRE